MKECKNYLRNIFIAYMQNGNIPDILVRRFKNDLIHFFLFFLIDDLLKLHIELILYSLLDNIAMYFLCLNIYINIIIRKTRDI